MSGSKLNPRVSYKTGQVESGGYLRRNDAPKSSSSPDLKGTFYLDGYGWVWLSAWENSDGFINVKMQDMTDDQARKFCAPKERRTDNKTQSRQQRQPTQTGGDSDIPF